MSFLPLLSSIFIKFWKNRKCKNSKQEKIKSKKGKKLTYIKDVLINNLPDFSSKWVQVVHVFPTLNYYKHQTETSLPYMCILTPFSKIFQVFLRLSLIHAKHSPCMFIYTTRCNINVLKHLLHANSQLFTSLISK